MNQVIQLPRRAATSIHLADGQKPFHDRRLWKLILRFIRDLQPDFVVNHGDDAECYHWSRWDKSPLDSPLGSKAWTADAEVAAVQGTWDQLHAAVPDATFIYALGNHEDRVRLHPQRTDPQAQRKADNFVDVFSAHKWWNHIVEYGYGIKMGHLWVTHGDTCTVYAARKMVQEWGACVAFGHTHKQPFWIEAPKGDWPKAAWGIPCHCLLDPHFTRQPGWMHGFGFCRFQPSGWFSFQVVSVIDYKFVFGDKFYQG